MIHYFTRTPELRFDLFEEQNEVDNDAVSLFRSRGS